MSQLTKQVELTLKIKHYAWLCIFVSNEKCCVISCEDSKRDSGRVVAAGTNGFGFESWDFTFCHHRETELIRSTDDILSFDLFDIFIRYSEFYAVCGV